MTVEISYYNVRLVSLSQCRGSEWLRRSFVHGVYNNTRHLQCNELNILLFANGNVVHLQTISTKTELPCLLCGRSATSAIPGIIGLDWSLNRCVSWRQRQWQCCSLHITDSMDALLAVSPSTFADLTVIATEGL